MNNKLNDYYRQLQKEEMKNVFYGEHDVISRPGFDSIEGFDKGISDLRGVISDYDSLILENQAKLKEVVRDLDFYKEHSNLAFSDIMDELNEKYEALLARQQEYLNLQEKEKKYLEELEEAKKEFIRESRFHYKNEAKDRVKLLDEYDAKMKEMKALEGKIAIGEGNGLDKARYDNLKNEVIPDLEELLGMKKHNDLDDSQNDSLDGDDKEQADNEQNIDENEDDLEIVSERDGTELTKKDKFKKIAKKFAKVAAVIGGAGLVAGAVYHFIKGDPTPISQVMHGVADAVGNVANNVDPGSVDLSSTSVGDYSTIFSSNDAVMNGVNAMTPNEWASDQIVGFVDANNVVTPAQTIGDIVNAQNQGIDVQSVAVGNGGFTPGNVSGFVDVDTINNVVGGHVR